MENGKMIKLMDLECLLMQSQELNMRVTGKTICNMAQEPKFMKTEINIKVCSRSQRGMAKGLMSLLMELYLRVNGKMEE